MRNYITLIVFFTVFLMSYSSFEDPVQINDIILRKEHIKTMLFKLKPTIKEKDADLLSGQFSYLSRKYKVSPKVLVAIAFQENAFRFSGISNNDIGLMQTNFIYQVKNKGLPYTIQQLNEDWRLNSELGVRYLVECMAKHKSLHTKPYSCYNSFHTEPAKNYQQRVERHLKKLESI